MKNIDQFSPYLFNFVKQKVDLSEFLSTEIGCRLNWYEPKTSAGMICPMPNHKDNNPSFRIKLIEGDNVWIYHCLGCGAKGTIIDFCMEYYGISSSVEAVLFICDKFGFKQSDISIADSLKVVQKRSNVQKRVNCAHVVAAVQCFTLLKKDFVKYNTWVKNSYKIMNKALDEEDLATIESIGFEASNKLQET